MKFVATAAAVVAAAVIPGCANRPPVIESVTVTPDTVPQNGRANIQAVATDPENDGLRFEWQAEAGSLSPSSADTVTWFAPKLVGTFTIVLAVRDSHENMTDTSFTVTVGTGGGRFGH